MSDMSSDADFADDFTKGSLWHAVRNYTPCP